MKLELADVLKKGIGDFFLKSIHWLNSGEDILIELVKNDDKQLFLYFIFVTNVAIDLKFNQLSGYGMIWDSTFTQTNNNLWDILIDFGGTPDGNIKFLCNDIIVSDTFEKNANV